MNVAKALIFMVRFQRMYKLKTFQAR